MKIFLTIYFCDKILRLAVYMFDGCQSRDFTNCKQSKEFRSILNLPLT